MLTSPHFWRVQQILVVSAVSLNLYESLSVCMLIGTLVSNNEKNTEKKSGDAQQRNGIDTAKNSLLLIPQRGVVSRR